MAGLLDKIPGMNIINNSNETCWCDSGQAYQHCCGPYLSRQCAAPTAEALMRSRFTAFARRDADYLLASWHPNTRPRKLDFAEETTEWQKLVIINTWKGMPEDRKGKVEFKAFYRQDSGDYLMHEISRFEKNGPHWFYRDGVIKALDKA